MPVLSDDNLDLYNSAAYNYTNFIKGQTLYRAKQTRVLSFDGQSALIEVREKNNVYQVRVEAESQRQSRHTCNCGQVTCPHWIASLITLRDYIRDEGQKQWQYRMLQALENTPKNKSESRRRAQYALLFGLKTNITEQSYSYQLIPYCIKISDWPRWNEMQQLDNFHDRNALLDADRSWIHQLCSKHTNMDPRTVFNLPMEGTHLFNVILNLQNVYYAPNLATYFSLMARVEMPIFRLDKQERLKERLYLQTEPVQVEASLTQGKDQFSLQAGVHYNDEFFTTLKGNLEVLSTDPAWMLAGDHLLPLSNAAVLGLLEYLPITFPATDQEKFREKFLQPIAERIPIQSDVIQWVEVDQDPVPRLYLRDADNTFLAELRFGYGDYEVNANPKAETLTLQDLPGSWSMLRIHRHKEQEEQYAHLLNQARYGLKHSNVRSDSSQTFQLRAHTHPLDFLLHSIPQLAQAGFEIYGQDDLKAGKINRNVPRLSLNIVSGIDWFDVQVTIHYGDQEASLREIRRALRNRENYVKLADGSIGQLPEAWLKRYKKVLGLAEETPDGDLRVREFHLPLIDTLLAEADESQVAADFQQRRERLRSFENIHPQTVPQGFVGELRPYQKAGLDWLRFLYEYGFGGCLADDMGLGKTIQVLAFLQSLKEQGELTGPSLLVVPKSLIANWLREAEHFTPELRFLEFTGNTRKKDPAEFAGYDVILTTYGTLLRDIEFLRSYPFFYAILDESQNIKNPMAQSSKAVRLIHAAHRLVMTGTPVENNTFELWSQFAFINPGLLGSVDYFREEFAIPVESHSNEESAQMLRRLVYPFILRRTKAQVAPELPERTERILYTDLEPAQRKFYNQTRDYYRDLLLGMIEEQGMNNTRMKILEGMLRLRQICIHPALVNNEYHGESAKFLLLLETLETLHAEGHKALIFSQFVQTLTILRQELDARHIRYAYLDGQTHNRQEKVDLFQEDTSVAFFLISLKAGGVGLNLTAADYVIHIDPWWNPAVEMQAADRAHRIGQDKPVFIYKIIARNSIEEKILQLQEHKRSLVEQLITSESSFFKSITQDDVRALFS